MHADLALRREICNEASILGSHRTGGNSGWNAVPCVRQAIFGAAHRTDQRRHRSQFGGSLCSRTAIDDGLAVCIQGMTRVCFARVEREIEQDDLARDLAAT